MKKYLAALCRRAADKLDPPKPPYTMTIATDYTGWDPRDIAAFTAREMGCRASRSRRLS